MIDILTILKATEAAAISCYDFIGKGDEKLADKAAVDAMRSAFNNINFKAKIVIGEGERDKAPMLYIGEEVGKLANSAIDKRLLAELASARRFEGDSKHRTGMYKGVHEDSSIESTYKLPAEVELCKDSVQYDIAVDPLEGTTICAKAMPGSLSVLSITESGGMLHAPDVYMDKIASNTPPHAEIIDLDESIKTNLQNLAKYKKCSVNDLKIIILDRPRHSEIISKIRELGARIHLISDGDIAAVISVALNQADLYLGIGGAPEGVLAASALKTLGGQFMGRLICNSQDEINNAQKLGITDLNKKYHLSDLVSKDSIFCATGVTSGKLLKGIKKITDSKFLSHSLVLSSKEKEKIEITRENI